MRQLITISLLLISAVVSYAQEGFRGEHFIESTGTAQLEIEPNEIFLFVLLREFEEERQKVSLEQLDKDFLQALKKADIDLKQVELAGAGSQLGKIGRKQKDAFREKSYQVKLTSATTLEKLVEKLEAVKVTQATITRVWHSDMEKLKLDLKVKALQAARAKAEVLVKSVNAELGKPLMIRDWDMTPQPGINITAVSTMMEKSMDAAPAEEEAIGFRKINLQVQVMAQFEIK